MFRTRKVALAVLAVFGGMAATVAVQAQEAQRVEVTGSRLQRTNLISPTPVLTLDASAFGNLGLENFADLATQLPSFAPSFGSSRTQSTFSGVETSGLNAANLRNLGNTRSLVLINGRRVPGGTSTSTLVDFNSIPTANIERVEVITGGASAIYGADAVAGVVNIITKRNFNGLEVGLGYGVTEENDNTNPSGHLMFGTKFGGSGRALLTLQFDKQGRVSCADRYICAEDFFWGSPATQLRGPAAYSGVGLGGRFFVGNAAYTRRNGSFTDANGALIPFAVATDGYNRNADRDIAIPTKRTMAAAEVEYDLGGGLKGFGELNWAQTTIKSEFEGHPFQSQQPGSLFGTLQATIPISNPFIPAPLLAAAQGAGVTNMTWWQRFNDAGGPRGADTERTTTRAVVGLKGNLGSLAGFGRDWRWELSHTWGRTEVELNTEGLVNTSNLYHGLRVEADPANPGGYRCIDATARAGGCIPINPFADYTPEMQKALRIGSVAKGHSVLNDTVAYLSGTAFDLPAGSVRTVIGAEIRSYSGFLDRDDVVNNALATGNQISDTDYAKTTTKEIFAELLVPILADKPFANSMNLEAAFRHSDTKTKNYNTWKLGGDWEPVTGLRFRAMQARSVRAPTPTDLSGVGLTAGVINDPCTAARRNANPTRAANCDADGVPANYDPPVVIEQSVSGLSGGNPNLAPEKGTTLTFGLVWQPTFAKGLSLTIDRFDIEIEGAITTLSRSIAVNKCYDTVNRLFCNVITRGTNPVLPGANYVLTSVNEQLANIASYNVKGVDVDLRYAFKLPSAMGDMDLSLLGTVYDKATLTPLVGETPINLLGQAGGSTSDQGWVRFTANANVGWKYKSFNANWNMRHIGSADMDESAAADGFPKIGAHTYHNVRVGYQVNKDIEVYGGITNLFNKQPPFFGSGRSGTQALDTVPGYYDVFGRSFFAGLRAKF